MELSMFKGILTGLILSLPFGPVGIYCTELTIVEGRWKGYVTALGMVTIDVVYSLISLLFISKVEQVIIKYENFLTIGIGIFLMCVALKKIFSKFELKDVNIEFKSMLQNYFTGLFFALANITSVLIITMIFTALRVYKDESPTLIYEIMLGVFIGGSSLWFMTTNIVASFREKLNKEKVIKLIKGVNILLLVISFAIVIKSLLRYANF